MREGTHQFQIRGSTLQRQACPLPFFMAIVPDHGLPGLLWEGLAGLNHNIEVDLGSFSGRGLLP